MADAFADECGGLLDHIGEELSHVPDTVTVLVCREGYRAAKLWRGEASEPEAYRCGLYFEHEQHEVRGIVDVLDLLTSLSHRSRACVVRGVPRADVGPVIRRLLYEASDGTPPTLESVPRRWVALDHDRVRLDDAQDLAREPERAIEALQALLPRAFRRAACVWQLSASAGMGDPREVSARLWFYFDRAVGDDELRRWQRETAALVDPALFNAVQPHYTAAPLFVDGARDPIPRRIGYLPGTSTVSLPAYPERPAAFVPLRAYGGDIEERARKYVARMPVAISGARGHDATWLAALALTRGFDLPESTALEILAAEHNPNCEPQWSERELRHKVQSAARAERVPRGYLLGGQRG